MSKNKIVEYVMNTPGNTNRAILSQMVDLETEGALEIAKQMDAETLAMAKAYTNSQRLGYTIPSSVVTFDGDTSGKIVSGNMVKISDTEYNVRTITKLIVNDVMSSDGNVFNTESYEINVDQYIFQQDEDTTALIDPETRNLVVAYLAPGNASFGDIPAGLYVFCGEIKSATEPGQTRIVRFVSYIEFEETVHQINPKFIPDKTIRLVDYSLADGTLNDIIASAVTSFGGEDRSYAGSDERFWADIINKRPDYVVLSLLGHEVRIGINVIVNEGSKCFSISFSGPVLFAGVSIEVKVVISNEEQEQSTYIKVTSTAF